MSDVWKKVTITFPDHLEVNSKVFHVIKGENTSTEIKGISLESTSIFIGIWAKAPVDGKNGVKKSGWEYFHSGYTFVGDYTTVGKIKSGKMFLNNEIVLDGVWGVENTFSGKMITSKSKIPNPWDNCYPNFFGTMHLTSKGISNQVLNHLSQEYVQCAYLVFLMRNSDYLIKYGGLENLKFYYTTFVDALNRKTKEDGKGLKTSVADARINSIVFHSIYDTVFAKYIEEVDLELQIHCKLLKDSTLHSFEIRNSFLKDGDPDLSIFISEYRDMFDHKNSSPHAKISILSDLLTKIESLFDSQVKGMKREFYQELVTKTLSYVVVKSECAFHHSNLQFLNDFARSSDSGRVIDVYEQSLKKICDFNANIIGNQGEMLQSDDICKQFIYKIFGCRDSLTTHYLLEELYQVLLNITSTPPGQNLSSKSWNALNSLSVHEVGKRVIDFESIGVNLQKKCLYYDAAFYSHLAGMIGRSILLLMSDDIHVIISKIEDDPRHFQRVSDKFKSNGEFLTTCMTLSPGCVKYFKKSYLINPDVLTKWVSEFPEILEYL